MTSSDIGQCPTQLPQHRMLNDRQQAARGQARSSARLLDEIHNLVEWRAYASKKEKGKGTLEKLDEIIERMIGAAIKVKDDITFLEGRIDGSMQILGSIKKDLREVTMPL